MTQPATPAGDEHPEAHGSVEDVLAVHGREAAETVAAGDPAAIKKIYRDLGEDLAAAVGDADAPRLSYPETQRAVASELADGAGLHLDAGCGPNPEASFLVAETSGRAMVGLDIGEGMVAMARGMAERRGVDFLGVVADLERLPFRDGVFGSVVCDDTVEHLPDDAAGMSELVRVSRDDARLVVATPNRRRSDVLVRRVRDLLRGRRHPRSHYYATSSHLREYTWRELEELLAPHAAVVGRGFVPWSGGPLERLATAIARTRAGRGVRRVVLVTLRPHRSG